MMRRSTCALRALIASVVTILGSLAVVGAPAGAGAPVEVSLPGWTLPGQPAAHLISVSCVAAKDCMALGTVADATGADQAFASHRVGSTWSTLPVHFFEGHTSLVLSSVSCPSAVSCMAVGTSTSAMSTQPVVASFDGSRWDARTLGPEFPEGHQAAGLSSVSCPSAASCVAVGWTRDLDGVDQALVFHYDDTSGWMQQETTGPPLTHLSSVSCTSDTACTAVGSQGVVPSVQRPVVATLQAGTWDIRALALGAATTAGGLLGVSCPAAEDCTAVGFSARKGVTRPMVATRAGAGWSTSTPPVDLQSQSASDWPTLSSVSCTAVGSCAAVGSSGGSPSATVEVLRNGRWRSPNLDDRTHSGTQALLGVSCVDSTRDCTAVGSAWGTRQVAVASPHGGGWRMRTASNPDGPIQTVLSDVSCGSPTSCVAVARSTNSLGANTAALDIYDGSSWTPTPLPKIDGVPRTFTLSHVSCPSPTWCAATATAFLWQGASSGPPVSVSTPGPVPARGVTRSYLLVDAAGTWSARAIPRSREWADNGSGSPLINCPEVDHCTVVSAVGNWTGSPREAAAVRFDGSGFDTTTFPLPQGADQVGLFDSPESLSCPTVTWCAVVGGASGHPWAAIGDGSSWTVDALSLPVGFGSAGLTLVSCWAPGSCKAIGQEDSGALLGQFRSFTADLDGGRWTSHYDLGGPVTSSFVQFTGLSCAGARSCVVVGSDVSIVGGQLVSGALLGSDASGSFTPTEISVPSPMVGATFSGVSCAGSAPRTCMAVGGAGTSAFGLGAVPIVAVGTFGPG